MVFEESKEEVGEERVNGNGIEESHHRNGAGCERGGESDSEESDSPFEKLPPEIAQFIEGGADRRYKDEEELQSVLDTAGVGDLNIVLVDNVARIVMVKEQHNTFTTAYVDDMTRSFDEWALVSGTHLVHLDKSTGSQKARRMPDINIWSYTRLKSLPSGRRTTKNDCRMPDVIIQFSWKNQKPYERGAIDDIMNHGLDREEGSPSPFPRVGYLIKAILSKKRTLHNGNPTQDLIGLHIYRQPLGTTMGDAENNQNGARHWVYKPTEAAYSREVEIIVSAEDLGFSGWEAWYFHFRVGKMVLRASEIFQDMQDEQTNRQSDGLKY